MNELLNRLKEKNIPIYTIDIPEICISQETKEFLKQYNQIKKRGKIINSDLRLT